MKFFISEYLRKAKERRIREAMSEITHRAEELYQIREFHGELWITYNEELICPCAMLNVMPIEALRKMRVSYVTRKTTELSLSE